ncbi:peptide deformylase [Sciscionella sediminilitoris]|uniref:peptide deformylase n=1 Tax=Sciscionella sediminilitoris TaxID=1445613 RepID=UPI0004DF9EC9|nr:peptide deformylase [Sciscionella sp. SE31]
MTVRPLRLHGDPVLRDPCSPVTRFDDGLQGLVTDLLDTVQLPGRAGLAAPQIGVSLAAFAYNVDGELGCVLNPEITHTEGDYDGPEACLSVPGVQAETPRAWHVIVSGLDRHGEPIRVEGTGELARCLQHETDHLAGILYLDRLPPERRRPVMRALREQQARPTR